MSSPFGNHQSSGVWCRIAGGKVVRKAEETTPGAVKVEIKKNGQGTGEFRWELHDDNVNGRIISFERRSQQFAGEEVRTLIVRLMHRPTGTQVNVQLSEGGRYWRAFMYRLGHVVLAEDVTIAPYDFIPDGEAKPRIGLNIQQGGSKVPAQFSRENTGGMPDAVKVMFKGKERLDFTAQDDWLNQNVLLPVNVKLTAITNADASTAADVAAPEPEELDDLPF